MTTSTAFARCIADGRAILGTCFFSLFLLQNVYIVLYCPTCTQIPRIHTQSIELLWCSRIFRLKRRVLRKVGTNCGHEDCDMQVNSVMYRIISPISSTRHHQCHRHCLIIHLVLILTPTQFSSLLMQRDSIQCSQRSASHHTYIPIPCIPHHTDTTHLSVYILEPGLGIRVLTRL